LDRIGTAKTIGLAMIECYEGLKVSCSGCEFGGIDYTSFSIKAISPEGVVDTAGPDFTSVKELALRLCTLYSFDMPRNREAIAIIHKCVYLVSLIWLDLISSVV